MTQHIRTLTTSLAFLLLAINASFLSAQTVRPFKLDAQATWDDLNNAFNPMVGAAFQDGSGTASHLGKFTATANLFATGAPDINGDFPVVGSVVLVAADGDELYTTYSGILNINGNGIAYYQFVGGTGRFGGAGGNGLIIASFDLSGGLQNVPMDSQWFGTVKY